MYGNYSNQQMIERLLKERDRVNDMISNYQNMPQNTPVNNYINTNQQTHPNNTIAFV